MNDVADLVVFLRDRWEEEHLPNLELVNRIRLLEIWLAEPDALLRTAYGQSILSHARRYRAHAAFSPEWLPMPSC